MHARHLSFLREGLLLSDRGLTVILRDILETCKRFTGLVERWGGDVLPDLLVEGGSGEQIGDMVKERAAAVREVIEVISTPLFLLPRKLTVSIAYRHCTSCSPTFSAPSSKRSTRRQTPATHRQPELESLSLVPHEQRR